MAMLLLTGTLFSSEAVALTNPLQASGEGSALPKPEAAADLVLGTAYWVDTSGQASFNQARQQAYTPYKGVFNRGYTNDVHWIRLSLAASPSPAGLRVTPAWLDELTLYDPANPGPARTVGDRFPVNRNAFDGLGFSFDLPMSAEPRDVWLRLKTTSAHRLDPQVMPVDQMAAVNSRYLLWAVLYTLVLLLIFLVLLVVWLVQPDQVLGAFLLRHVVVAFFGMAYLGLPTWLLSDWLPPAFFDMAFSIAAIASLPLGLQFDIVLLSGYRPKPYLLRTLRWMAWVGAGLVVLVLAGHQRLALELNVQIITFVVLCVYATAWSCKPEPSVEQLMPKRVMMGYYTLILGGLMSGLVGVLGWGEPSSWQLYILILHGLASALVMSSMLFVRGNRQLYQSQQLSLKLRKAEQEVELEQQRRQEQSQFLHMLMHELKTPLSVVSMALGTRDNKENNLRLAGQAVQDMKAVIERCVQADRLGTVVLENHVQAVDLQAEILALQTGMDGLKDRLRISLTSDVLLHTDRQLLQTILSNLLENAVRYSDPVTPVDVQAWLAREDGRDGMLLRVSNTPGLAGWPDPERIFSKYYRASGAHRESGSGLGLFLAQQLTRTLQGSLRYQPTDSQVRFELWIPRART